MIITRVRNPENNAKYLLNKRLLVSGTITGTDQYDIASQITTIETALAVDNQSGGLLHDNNTETPHWINNVIDDPSNYNGVRVLPIRWGGESKAEFTKFRSFELQLEADYTITNNKIISLVEELTFIGTGGPRYAHVELLTGLPVKQTINQRTAVRAIQRGEGVWTEGTHAIPDPIWPAFEDQEQRNVGRLSVDLNTKRYTRRWAYYFSSVGPFVLPPQPLFVANNWTLQNGDNLVWQNGDNAVLGT